MRRHEPKTKNKEIGAIGPRKGIRTQDQILALKSQKGKGRVVVEFRMVDTASVVLSNSKSQDERKK